MRYFVSAATQYEKHPLSRFISYSLDFYEIVNHALWYYYIAYLVYCYCYVTTTIRNATRLSIFTSTFLYLSSSLHMKNIVIKYHKVKFVCVLLSVRRKNSWTMILGFKNFELFQIKTSYYWKIRLLSKYLQTYLL